ncbi:polysaccharide biosynthesis tyrosine autokinase [Paraburkholderia sp. UYCP14C]|uniref:polysaccharide biosynthesis tyrosine autokinase n=1 Tax=Paraburkholderia sp. UYCP14C TaxID=2511130 RepID=UPI00101F8988|nr:polysaccharide biosynthesis tyrosine autokinase [Paraburkholderia sp. UYCP14C]RZF24861.1 polysaccharide biosynthesis tyrosine autokinase [Paraburkholderia sp. UYCP14C]
MASMKQITRDDPLQSDEVSISDYLRTIGESWRLIGMIALSVLALGSIYGMMHPTLYRADALIQIGTPTSSSSDAEAMGRLASIFDSKVKASADAEIELIRSRLVVGETVRQLNLQTTAQPRYFPLIGRWIAGLRSGSPSTKPLFGLRQFAWSDESIEVSKFDVPHAAVGQKFVVKAGRAPYFKLISPDGKALGTGAVGQELVVPFADGKLHLLVNKLSASPGGEFTLKTSSIEAAILALIDALVISERKAQTGMVGIALEGPDPVRTADIVNTIAQEYLAQDLARRSSEAEHSLLFLESQLPKLRDELQQAEDRYNAFRNSKGTVDLSVESRLLLQQEVDLDTAMRGLLQQRDDISQHYREGYPQLTAVDSKIARLQQDREALNQRVASLPDMEQTAVRLMRNVQVDTELYTNLLNSAQQLRVIKAGNVGNVRIVDLAVPPERSSKPNWQVLLSLSAVLGLVMGVVTAFLRKALSGGIERSAEIEEALGIPVCAVVPHSERQVRLQEAMRRKAPGIHVLAAVWPGDVAVEGVRSLRTALQSIGSELGKNVVMITSSRPGVGKSFLAANLAAVLATGGKKVLLIDADMRMGDMHMSFNPAGGPGLTELLKGAALDDVVIRDVMDGVDLISRGGESPNAADLLTSGRLGEILDVASRRYDVVVVDTPPVLAVTDATLIGRQAGTTLLVVRHGRQPVGEVYEALSRLQNGGVHVAGTLFTDVPLDKARYGSGYGSAYGTSGIYGRSGGETNVRIP